MAVHHIYFLVFILLGTTAVLSTMAVHLRFGAAEPARALRLRRWNQRRGCAD